MTPEERFEQNRGLAYHIAFRYKVPEEDRDDLIQEAELALWRACLGYDDARPNRFTTYAGRAIENACSNFARTAWNSSGLSAGREARIAAARAQDSDDPLDPKYARLLSTALSTEYLIHDDEDGGTLGDTIAVTDTYDIDQIGYRPAIEAALESLDKRSRRMVVSRYGLETGEPKMIREVAEEFGVSKQTVSLVLARALARLRHPRNSEALKRLL